MQYLLIIFTSVLLVIPSLSIADGSDPFQQSLFKIPPKYQKDFVNYRQRFKRMSGFEFSGLHWNNFVVVYSGLDESVYKKNYFEFLKFLNMDEEDEEDEDMIIDYQLYPVGAVVIKENYSNESSLPREPVSLTIMKKMPPGYNPKNGDWLYLQSDRDGNIMIEGKHGDPGVTKVCSECHSNIKERDFIFSTFFTVN